MKEEVELYLKRAEKFRKNAEFNFENSIGLSDIDVAIVSNEFELRKNKLRVYDVLFEKYFDSPFEFHLLTVKRWKFFSRFIGKDLVKV